MKRSIIAAIAGATLLFTGYSQATNIVFSVNMVGFQKVEIEPGDALPVAAPFIVNASNTLENIIGDQTDPSTVVWTFNGTTWEDNQNFGGTWFNLQQGVENTEDFIPGTSFLVQNNTGSTQEVVIVGEVVPSMVTTSVLFGASLSAVSNPYSSDLDLNSTNVTLQAAMNAGDTIWTYDAINNTWEDNQSFGGTLFNLQDGIPSPPIPSGSGFLYVNTGANVVWVQPPLY